MLGGVLLLGLGGGAVLVAAVVCGYLLVLGRVLGRRKRVHDRAVAAAFTEGKAAGVWARRTGGWGKGRDLPLLTFRPEAPARTRKHVLDTNCVRAYLQGWLRGYAQADLAALDAELEAEAAEQAADGVARLEAYANGERV